MRWQILLGACIGATLAGCVIEAHPNRSDLTVHWKFSGDDCKNAGVSSVSVQLFDAAGDQLANDTFPCSQASATYTDLALGSYSFDVSGLSGGSVRLYELTGTLNVNDGSNSYDLNLTIPP